MCIPESRSFRGLRHLPRMRPTRTITLLAPFGRHASTVVESLRSRLATELPELADFIGSRDSLNSGGAKHRRDRSSEAEFTATSSDSRIKQELIDRFLRRHTYLRISLTERCSLRCVYCMPADGVKLTPNSQLLYPDEIQRLAAAFVRAGVDKIRLTGGEPTVREDIVDVVAGLDALRPLGLKQIAMTSNGIALSRLLPPLRAAGLDRLNISLDTLQRELFAQITRRDGLPRVLKAIDLASEMGFSPLKVNCVLMANVNEQELLDFAALAVRKSLDVRFIEYMPFDGNSWSMDKVVPHSRVMSVLHEAYPGMTKIDTDAHDVAVTWRPEQGDHRTPLQTSMLCAVEHAVPHCTSLQPPRPRTDALHLSRSCLVPPTTPSFVVRVLVAPTERDEHPQPSFHSSPLETLLLPPKR